MLDRLIQSRTIVAVCVLAVMLASAGSVRAGRKGKYVPAENLRDGWYARIETDMGRIVVRLLPEQAPQAVAHFVGLARGSLEWMDPVSGDLQKGRYYDGIMIDLAAAGQRFEAGGLDGEPSRVPPKLFVPQDQGLGPITFNRAGRMGLTMAVGGKVSAVKFFITATGQRHLIGAHPCLGEVVEGIETVFNMSGVKTYSNGRPVDPVHIRKVRIFTVGEAPPLPEPSQQDAKPTLKILTDR